MDRDTAQSELTGTSSVRFALATSEHDPLLRRLLRENPLPGSITLSFEREPNYFAGLNLAGAQDDTIVAHEGGRLVCMGRCSTQNRFVNGRVCRVGYLGELRLDKMAQGRFDILRRGYEFFHELHREAPADFYFTSISADNERSIRFLERGLPGMPAYEFLTEFVTLLITVPRSAPLRHARALKSERALAAEGVVQTSGTSGGAGEIAHFLRSIASRYHLAPCWSEPDLSALASVGLPLRGLNLLTAGERIVGCAALWDQRSFRQIVIQNYDARIRLVKPLINCAARFLPTPSLPKRNSVVAQAFLSLFSLEREYESLGTHFITMLLQKAGENGIDYVTAGFDIRDPRLQSIRKHFSCREYQSRLYRVVWKGCGNNELFGPELFSPEVAFL